VDKLVQLTEDEFEHIEDTIARTAKGRAFLRRYARRTQGGSAEEVRLMLLQMREMLNRQNQATHTATHIDVLRRELLEMAGSIEKARREVAALRPPDSDDNRILSATSELDAIVTSTERASFDILNPSLDFLRGLTALQSDTNLLPGIEKGIVRDGRRHEADYRISVGLRPS
jgi:hypothetical protein